jgi:hypothetical protein
MKSLLLCLALAALPAFGGQRAASLAPIALYTQFQQDPPQAVLESLQAELESIMAPMGLSFEWRPLGAPGGNQVSVELAVVAFKGRCDVAGLLPRSMNPGALGWTHISDGAILPFADIDCEAVRSFVQKDLLAMRLADRAQVFGRALARVVAHELYHIFANTTHHGSDGVGRESYSVQNLLSPEFQFQARESLALRNSKAHTALAAADTDVF